MHGSSIKVDEGCVVLVGRSGVGKSTLATALRQRGYKCLGDDLCPISIGEDSTPYAAPAYPQAKLWQDALLHFGIDGAALRRIRPRMEEMCCAIKTGTGTMTSFQSNASMYSVRAGVNSTRYYNPSPVRGSCAYSETIPTGLSISPAWTLPDVISCRSFTWLHGFLWGIASCVPSGGSSLKNWQTPSNTIFRS